MEEFSWNALSFSFHFNWRQFSGVDKGSFCIRNFTEVNRHFHLRPFCVEWFRSGERKASALLTLESHQKSLLKSEFKNIEIPENIFDRVVYVRLRIKMEKKKQASKLTFKFKLKLLQYYCQTEHYSAFAFHKWMKSKEAHTEKLPKWMSINLGMEK